MPFQTLHLDWEVESAPIGKLIRPRDLQIMTNRGMFPDSLLSGRNMVLQFCYRTTRWLESPRLVNCLVAQAMDLAKQKVYLV